MKTLARAGVCALALCLLIPGVNAGTILDSGISDSGVFSITRTGSQSSNRFRFDISGDEFVFRVGTSEGPLLVAACPTPGVPCEIERSYPVGMLFAADLIQSFASFRGVSTEFVTGRLVVVGTVTPPTAPGEFQASIPIAFAGEVIGHYAPNEGSSELPVAFDVVIGAVGRADLRGVVLDSEGAVINGATYSFAGTALGNSEIPEPGAMFLTAGGLGFLALFCRRRRFPRRFPNCPV